MEPPTLRTLKAHPAGWTVRSTAAGRRTAALATLVVPLAVVLGLTGACRSKQVPLQLPSTEPRAAHAPQYAVAEHSQTWGELRTDTSVEQRPLTIAGKVYPNGLGTHAVSRVRISFPATFKVFSGACGVDGEVQQNGSVVFRVQDGETVLFESPVRHGSDPAVPFAVRVEGLSGLTLVVDDADRDVSFDHADWVNLELD